MNSEQVYRISIDSEHKVTESDLELIAKSAGPLIIMFTNELEYDLFYNCTVTVTAVYAAINSDLTSTDLQNRLKTAMPDAEYLRVRTVNKQSLPTQAPNPMRDSTFTDSSA